MVDSRSATSAVLRCRGVEIDCRRGSGPAHVMGVLNVTPDSFSDGGKFLETADAAQHAERMLDEGAAIIDIGGESSRPRGKTYGSGARALSVDEECARIIPVITELHRRRPQAVISVDTYKSATAREALAAGASMLNDITGLRHDSGMGRLAAEYDVPLVLMHSVGDPGKMPHERQYAGVVNEVARALGRSAEQATHSGATQIVLDPGFGFGKSTEDNLRLAGATDRFVAMGFPVLIGISRKSTIGAVLSHGDKPVPVESRLYGSLGATAVAVMRGAMIVRCHDVRPTFEFLKVLYRIQKASRPDR